ncbi:MAG: hypothetical protein NC215_00400 [Ruminococcus sp.]|nr:hypothetical protein [Ruminococcus sp.]
MPVLMDYIFEKVEKFDVTMTTIQKLLKQQLGINKTVAKFTTIMTLYVAVMGIYSVKHGRAIKKLQKEFEKALSEKGE